MPHNVPFTIRTLDYIVAQSKGWPVGIPIRISAARRLIHLGFVESAPCSYIHRLKKPVWAVRLTGAGHAHLKIYHDNKDVKS